MMAVWTVWEFEVRVAMKVMLTPPDLWGSTGYVSQADTGAPGATQTMYQVYTG